MEFSNDNRKASGTQTHSQNGKKLT